MYHAFGMCVFVTIILTNRARLVLMPRFTEEVFLQIIQVFNSTKLYCITGIKKQICIFFVSFYFIQTHKITTAFLVPPTMIFLAKSPIVAKYDLSSLHTVICGAAPLSKKMETLVKKRTRVQIVRQGYGMTETTYIVTCQNDHHHTNGSVGVLAKGVHARVVDVVNGKCLGPNEVGELHFKGHNMMKGYIGNAQATSATIDSEGFLHNNVTNIITKLHIITFDI